MPGSIEPYKTLIVHRLSSISSRMEAGTIQKSKEMTISKFVKDSEDAQTMTERKKVDWFVFLPDDILIDILKRVPEVFLRYKVKYVCRRWFKTITNRILIDHASFILQNLRNFKTRLVDIWEEEEDGLQVKEQVLDIPFKGIIRCWCNEFVVISDPNNLYVYNVITKEGSYLPQCNAYCGRHYTSNCAVTLCFDGFKGVYKVAHLFSSGTIGCQILTLRRDENHAIASAYSMWKKLEGPIMNGRQHYLWGDPVTVQGRYLNWIMVSSDDQLVSVDMVKEEIRIINLPGSRHEECVYSLFVMGGILAFMRRVSCYKSEIWLLKDFDSVKWDKLPSISDINRFFNRFPGMISKYPICGFLYKRYIISKCLDGMYSYDLKSGVQKKLDIHIPYTVFQSEEHCVVRSLAPCFK